MTWRGRLALAFAATDEGETPSPQSKAEMTAMGWRDRMPGLTQPWTSAQRGVLIALVLALALYAGIRYALNPMHVSNPQPLVPARANELADRIDPNTADVDSLAALPLIGDKRARDIVTYRERFTADHPGEIAFRKPDDLLRIRGIGASMVDQLKPYLLFPSTTHATTSQEQRD